MSSDIDAVRLGQSGLQISRLVLGCMSFGESTAGPAPVDPRRGRRSGRLLTAALDAGITTWDTANVYSGGLPVEEIVGQIHRQWGFGDSNS